MLLQSVRELKLEVAGEVYQSLRDDILNRGFQPRVGSSLRPSPLHRLALGIALGRTPGEFSLAIRLQRQSPPLQALVERLKERAHNDVDVAFVGVPRAQDDAAPAPADLKKKMRPIVVGCSIGHIAATGGTLGLIARHRKTGHAVMLSNSHVLALSGRGVSGDPITQPGRVDGGGQDTIVGALLDSTPLKSDSPNLADAAIAMIGDDVPFSVNSVPGLGQFTIGDEGAILLGAKVQKIGRTTGLRRGEVTAIELDDVGVEYDTGEFHFDKQLEIRGEPGLPFSADGDSGSLVFDAQMRAIGLVFAGNPELDERGVSFANHLPTVMTMLDLIPL
ncbi:hypothetical protein AMST5_00135 [freshwater sediment metagenome]|uniref:Serine protease n=1 Tax=freshwater sediment metagenome TaxID=556182 RepID=A0AA48LWW5_9ZZZZ